MTAIITIFKRDISRMIQSNIVATIVVLFLIMMGALFFEDYFKEVQALNLRQFFSQAPLLLSIFCPALSMATIADERAHQTLDLLQTMPVRSSEIIIAKFLCCLVLLCFVLAMTLSYPLSLSTLGSLDWGPVFGGYIALILLGAAYLALGILASACAKDQITAFLIAFFLCFALTYIQKLSLNASGTMATILQNLSAGAHFSNIARGVVDIRDILYAVSIQFFALSAAILQLESKKYPVMK